MASKFSFTEEQFRQMKRMMQQGKTLAEIGKKYDLSGSTMQRVRRAATFTQYRRNRLIDTYNRKRAAAQRTARHRRALWGAAALAGLLACAFVLTEAVAR